MGSNFTQNKEPDFVTKKKNFRQQIRREYLADYFGKKRADYFGWSHQEYLDANKSSNNFSYTEVQIDKEPFVQLRESLAYDLKPAYNQNYFNQMDLLGKMIEKNETIEIDTDSNQSPNNFLHKTFYGFMVTVIKESLDNKYFRKFENYQVFVDHFQALKENIYQKLGQEVQNLLIQFHCAGKSGNEENNSFSEESSRQTYHNLVIQLENFMQCPNLQVKQQKQWPLIKVQEQLIFLLKILIEITYYDEPMRTDNILQTISKNEDKKIEEKYSKIFNSQQEQEELKSSSVTEYLINESGLLQRLKFLIVFGHQEANNDRGKWNGVNGDKQQMKSEKERKYREIQFILHLLSNISYNIGSDILFQNGIINQLKCLLRQPYYSVNISSKHRDHQIPKPYRQIISFIIEAFELIKRQSSLKFLSQMDSLSFVLQTLVQVTKMKKEFQHFSEFKNEKVQVGNQFLLIGYENDREFTNFDDQEEKNEQDNVSLEKAQHNHSNKQLTELAQKCIENIEFHLLIGANLPTDPFHYQSRLQNPYLLKLKYLIMNHCQQPFWGDYERGKQLLERWNLRQN